MARVLERSKNPELAGIAEILSRYSPALELLDEYDHGTLKKPMPARTCTRQCRRKRSTCCTS
jgi:hypothetical protein